METGDEKPSTWTVRKLKIYATIHNLTVLSGMEKDQLVKLVEEHMDNQLFAASIRERHQRDSSVMDDILSESDASILAHAAYSSYATTLRQNPKKLESILHAGLTQLQSLPYVIQTCCGELHPAVEAWLAFTVNGEDGASALTTAIAPPTATTSACGHYFSPSEMVVRCLDCAADPTCVMCMECFRDSPCAGHRFRISKGSGGGMCDCGDHGAWKPESFCRRHCGTASSRNPLDAIPPSDREWVTVVLRGVVQFTVLSILQYLRIAELKRQAKKSTATQPSFEADVQRIPENSRWLSDWLESITTKLSELSDLGETARRLFSTLLMEPLPFAEELYTDEGATSSTRADDAASTDQKDEDGKSIIPLPEQCTCLHVLFLYQVSIPSKETRKASEEAGDRWWTQLCACVAHCLADATFRQPFGALQAMYAECIFSRSESGLSELMVQVLTNHEVLDACMVPAALPYHNPHDTILHRILTSILFAICATKDHNSMNHVIQSIAVEEDGIVLLPRAFTEKPLHALQVLTYCLTGSEDARTAWVVSRTAIRGFLRILNIVALSGYYYKDRGTYTFEYGNAEILGRVMIRDIWRWQSHIGRIIEALSYTTVESRSVFPWKQIAALLCPTAAAPEKLLDNLRGSVAFDTTPDPKRRRRDVAQVLRSCSVEDPDDALLILEKGKLYTVQQSVVLPRIGAAASSPSPQNSAVALGYVLQVLYEIGRDLDVFFEKQRIGFCRCSEVVVLQRRSIAVETESKAIVKEGVDEKKDEASDEEPQKSYTSTSDWNHRMDIQEYSLLSPQAHALSFSNHLHHFFAAVVSAWVQQQQQCRSSDTRCGAQATRAMAAPLRAIMESYLQLRQAVSEVSHDTEWFCTELIDSIVMPHVLISQVTDGLWSGVDRGADVSSRMYRASNTYATVEYDILMLQILALVMPPADLTAQVLQRFSYGVTARHRGESDASQSPQPLPLPSSKRPSLRGYATYLRLILTIVTDVSKAGFAGPFSSRSVDHSTAHLLATHRMLHSDLQSSICSSVRGSEYSAYDDAFDDEEGRPTELSTLLQSAMSRLAIGENSAKGKSFRLKSSQVFRDHVGLYQSLYCDKDLPFLYDTYRGLVALERAQDSSGQTESASSSTEQQPISLPPSTLRESDSLYAELVAPTRALLHTDSVLIPALYVLHQFVWDTLCSTGDAMGSGGGPKVAGEAETGGRSSRRRGGEEEAEEEESDDDQLVAISPELLLHAITTLYLCMKDCMAISKMKDVAVNGDEEEVTGAPRSTDTVVWEHVEKHREQNRLNECSFTEASVAVYMALPELVEVKSLVEKFQTPVVVRHSATVKESTGVAVVQLSTIDALHRLRLHLMSNKDNDRYGCLEMVESVLLDGGFATFTVASSKQRPAEDEEAVINHKKRLRERQAQLLQRMRTRANKSTAGTAADTMGSANKAAEGKQEDVSPTAITTASSGFLHTKLLFDLTEADCCVCRTTTAEPLYLLCRTGASSALGHLQSAPMPDQRPIHATMSICGHAAHLSCIEKTFVRLAKRWRDMYLHNPTYLGPTELACPVCSSITMTLSPLPTLSGIGTTGVFEELQAYAVANHQRVASQSSLPNLHTTLAECAVGLSTSEDAKPLITEEDDLQKNHHQIWELSESIRVWWVQAHLLLEAVKMGNALHYRDLIGLLSLLLSMSPEVLRREWSRLECNFTRASEGISILLMQCLTGPGAATTHIAQYVISLMRAMAASTMLPRLLRSGGEELCQSAEDADAGALLQLWKELGVLTLLKMLLVDDPCSIIVKTSGDLSSSIDFVTLNPSVMTSPKGRVTAVLRMLQYLTLVRGSSEMDPLDAVSRHLESVINAASGASLLTSTVVASPGAVVYRDPSQWAAYVAEKLMNLPRQYTKLLMDLSASPLCVVCHRKSVKPLLCCRCGKYLCLQPKNQPPELYDHTKKCWGAVGIYVVLRAGSYVVMELLTGRVYQPSSTYTDEYGEQDANLYRGVPLYRNDELMQKLLLVWLLNKWGAEAHASMSTSRMDLTMI